MTSNSSEPPPGETAEPATETPSRKAGPLQVAKTMFFGLFAIGMKGTLEKDGAKVTPAQLVIGAFVGGAVLVLIIITVVHFVLKFAMPGR